MRYTNEVDNIKQLIAAAKEVRLNSYSPYSKYQVGAAILCASGQIYAGCNAEVASYTGTEHAETAALASAISAGEALAKPHFIEAVAVVTADGAYPCGNCLQRLTEHTDDCDIYVANDQGEILQQTTLKKMLPVRFKLKNKF